MKKDHDYYDGLPWRVVIDPEQQEDGRIIFVASHPDLSERIAPLRGLGNPQGRGVRAGQTPPDDRISVPSSDASW